MSIVLGHHQLTQRIVTNSCSMRANQQSALTEANARSIRADVADGVTKSTQPARNKHSAIGYHDKDTVTTMTQDETWNFETEPKSRDKTHINVKTEQRRRYYYYAKSFTE